VSTETSGLRPFDGTLGAVDRHVVTRLRTKCSALALIVGLLAATAGPVFTQDRHPVCETKHHDCGKPATISSWELCERYAWPGNIRELQNIVERASSAADRLGASGRRSTESCGRWMRWPRSVGNRLTPSDHGLETPPPRLATCRRFAPARAVLLRTCLARESSRLRPDPPRSAWTALPRT
jgi:hypothetical protein